MSLCLTDRFAHFTPAKNCCFILTPHFNRIDPTITLSFRHTYCHTPFELISPFLTVKVDTVKLDMYN